MTPPTTIARVSGWLGVAFLLGISLYSLRPNDVVDMRWLTVFVVLSISVLLFAWKNRWVRTGAFCLLAILLGVLRFDATRFTMPRGLIPFDPKGLAFQTGSSLPSNVQIFRSFKYGRTWLTQRSNRIFSPDESALLTGILYGDRNLSKEVKAQFRKAGLLHIIAVSGSNVTIVVVLAMRFLLALGLSRRRAFVGLTGALIAFVLFVDPGASVVRAAIMGWLVEFAPIVGRIPRPSRLLLLSAAIFVAWKPWSLFFDASFALSFLAMWGLLTWGQRVDRWLIKCVPWSGLREIIASTTGATFMTLPYSAWAFGQASILGFFTNVLVLPLVPWVMAAGTAALAFPSVVLFVNAAKGFLEAILWIVRMTDRIPFGNWTHLSESFLWMAGCYVALWMVWVVTKEEKLSTEGTERREVLGSADR